MPTQSPGTLNLKAAIARGAPLEARGEALRERQIAGIGETGSELQRIRSGANLASQRQGSAQFGAGPRGFSRQLTQATRRGKARQGINNRGEAAVKNQQLKDRMSIARQSLKRRGQLIGSSADAARLRAGEQVATRSARDQESAAFSGAVGAIAGGAARGFGDLFNTGKLGQGIADQQREVDSFFDTGDLGQFTDFGGGFDFPPIGQGSV